MPACPAMPPRTEEDLRPHVRRHFEDLGYAVLDEVPFNGRVADLVAVRDGPAASGGPGDPGEPGDPGASARRDDVVAVELKLSDWQKAHVQAKAYQLGARRTYVALPLGKARRVAADHAARFQRSGVGLLGVQVAARTSFGAVRRLLEARPSDRTLPFLAEGLATGRVGRRRRRAWWRR